MGNRKKLKSYIQDDRPLKLKSYIASHKLHISSIILGHRRNLLHYCAQHGTVDMMRCLIKLKCDPSQQDKAGNLPLHLALQRGLREEIRQARETLTEIVSVLLDVYPLGQDVENKEGDTGHDLLTLLKKKIKSASAEVKSVTEAEKRESENLWMRKLKEEAMFEYEEGLSRYSSKDDFQQEESQLSYDDWFEKIRQDHDEKQRERHSFCNSRKRKHEEDKTEKSSSKKSYKQQRVIEDEKLRKAREDMKSRFKPIPSVNKFDRFIFKKQQYEKKFTHLLSHMPSQKLTFACIPWPSADLNRVVDILFCDLGDKQSTSFKKYLRTQQIRWHPDKFTQKFGDHLHPDHVSKVMGRVKAISQILNQLNTSITNS